MTKCGSEYATPEEVANAINELTSADYKKLMWAATDWWVRRHLQSRWAEPVDLLHDAVTVTLMGKKHWRKSSVTIVKHLNRAMENISGHLVAKGLKHQAMCDTVDITQAARTGCAVVSDGVLWFAMLRVRDCMRMKHMKMGKSYRSLLTMCGSMRTTNSDRVAATRL